jgi:hypothetical protein
MSSRRLKVTRPARKCKQCEVEPAIIDRKDGLGKNCGTHKDRGVEKAAAHAKAKRA